MSHRGPVTHKLVGIEQQRRDFKAAQGELYDYIVNIVATQVLDSAGDQASGAPSGPAAANRIWQQAAHHRQEADRRRQEHADRERGHEPGPGLPH
jgi:hypothetical protein